MIDRDHVKSVPLQHRGDEPHLLREILKTYQVLMNGVSKILGITSAQFSLMRLLALSETNVGVMDLSRQLGINAAAVTRQVKELEKNGLIRRRADPRDARRSYIRLSPKGERLFQDAHDRAHRLEWSIASAVGAEEMTHAAQVLVKLRTFMGEHL